MGQTLSILVKYVWPSGKRPIRFTSLGLAVLDELHFPSKEPLTDVLGGSGAFSILGARLFAQNDPASIGWLLRTGNDFPGVAVARLEHWGISLRFKEEDRPATRARLEYEDEFGDKKNFRYLTPVLNVLPSHLDLILLSSQSFHFLASPIELIEQVQQLLALRKKAWIRHKPFILWEPRPSSCLPSNLNDIFKAVRYVDVFSPNHLELLAAFGKSPTEPFNENEIRELAMPFLTSGIGGIGPSNPGTVVIRAGEHGCFFSSSTQPPTWIPAYYQPAGNKEREFDPTGAGNAFLGAFAMGYLETACVYEAACFGAVGASFAMEQIGLPKVTYREDGELWNGCAVRDRLREYKSRVKSRDGEEGQS